MIVSALFCCLISNAQKNKENKINKRFIGHSIVEDSYHSYEEIVQLVNLDSANAGYLYQKALLELNYTENYNEAILLFEKAKILKSNFKKRKAELMVPKELDYFLGCAYNKDQQYEKAISNFDNYLSNNTEDDPYFELVKLNKEQMARAIQFSKNPSNLCVINLGDEINSEYKDYSPVINSITDKLYFCSRRPSALEGENEFIDYTDGEHREKILETEFPKDSILFNSKTRLKFYSPNYNQSVVSLNNRNLTFYIYSDSLSLGDLFETKSDKHLLESDLKTSLTQINSEYGESHCVLSADGEKLFFSSNRPGGYGGRDLYMSNRNSDDSWGIPYNMGPEINSTADEESPFLSPSGKILYFSSNGKLSSGGFDVFYSLKNDTSWTIPVNMGYPINSPADDIYFTESLDGNLMLLSSDRKGGYGKLDLYKIDKSPAEINLEALSAFQLKITLNTDSMNIKSLSSPDINDLYAKIKCLNCYESGIIRSSNNDVNNFTNFTNDKLLYLSSDDSSAITSLDRNHSYELEIVNSLDNKILFFENITDTLLTNNLMLQRNYILTRSDSALVCYLDDSKSIKKTMPKNENPWIDIKEIKGVNGFINFEFTYYFDYNKSNFREDKTVVYILNEIEKQLALGRDQITFKIYSSASEVTTRAYESNEVLALLRAKILRQELLNYFNSISSCYGHVNVEIVSAKVDGPEFKMDANNSYKYKPFQFVKFKTE